MWYTNPALWTAVAGLIAAVTALITHLRHQANPNAHAALTQAVKQVSAPSNVKPRNDPGIIP